MVEGLAGNRVLIFQDLNGKRINLIKISMDGLDDMHEYSTNKKFYEFLEYEHFKSIEETRLYLKKLISRSKSNNHYWFIKLNKPKKIIGTFGLLQIDEKKGSSEIGYGLSPDYWKGGYFKEALLNILDYLFIKSNFHRIYAKTAANNHASIKSLKNCGFEIEGVLRDYYLSYQGFRSDAKILSTINSSKSRKFIKNELLSF